MSNYGFSILDPKIYIYNSQYIYNRIIYNSKTSKVADFCQQTDFQPSNDDRKDKKLTVEGICDQNYVKIEIKN